MQQPRLSVAIVWTGVMDRMTPRMAGLIDRLGRFDPVFLRGRPREQKYLTFGLVLILSAILSVASIILYVVKAGDRAEYVEIASNLQAQSQRAAITAQQAVLGSPAAFTQLREAQASFSQGIDALVRGNAEVPASPDDLQGHLAQIRQRWAGSSRHIDALLSQQAPLESLGQAVSQVHSQSTRLVDLSQRLLMQLTPGNRHWILANEQATLTQRLAKNANGLVTGDAVSADMVRQFGQEVRAAGTGVKALLAGDAALGISAVADAAARQTLLELQASLAVLQGQVRQIVDIMPRLLEAKQANRELFEESEALLQLTSGLTDRYEDVGYGLTLILAVLFGLITLASLLLLALTNVAESRRSAESAAQEKEEAARENRRNQEAILRLLNEMGDLAEGNLTIRTSVTEDITGAIADSVNFAIDELRTLVENVNRAAVQVTKATVDARQLSQEMLATAERQTQEIGSATEAVNFMSESIVQVSQNADESTRVAQQSLDFAKKGGDSVRNAIKGMNAIRDQIQETSKRIKRLGESSQEIGGIVELISDITEQTNVLALNAAIQAAAAGEAGRGFSVVAEEVQHLAERSAQATRRIGAIVKTIQSDTQDTVNAMEASTRGVVAGTALSDAAGNALQDIESVSAELARIIQAISAATRDQAGTAGRIADNMQQILKQTRQASDIARKSAASVGQLTVLADELRVSVAGFKL